jgi:hypothetical protein
VAQLAPTASGTRYLLERQFATCVGVSSGNDSRLLGVQSITVANGQAAFARLPLDSLPGWSDLGTGGAPHPTKPWLYLGSKYVQRVYAYSVDPVSGAAQPIAGSPFDAALVPSQGESTTPAMIVDPDGTFLYMANLNAGATHVDTFSINPTTGALSPVASYTP